MQNFNDSDANYSSELVNDLLSNIRPEDQEQTDYKMKLAAKIYAALKSKGWKSVQLAFIKPEKPFTCFQMAKRYT